MVEYLVVPINGEIGKSAERKFYYFLLKVARLCWSPSYSAYSCTPARNASKQYIADKLCSLCQLIILYLIINTEYCRLSA